MPVLRRAIEIGCRLSQTEVGIYASRTSHRKTNRICRSGMTDILLTTLNARYAHSAFGLRYLLANMGPELVARTGIREFTIQDRPIDIVEAILAHQPKIVGVGVYIWNTTEILAVVQLLKALRPDIKIILGGPEVSYETQQQVLTSLADVVITGEGEVTFPKVCATLLAGEAWPHHVVPGELPDVNQLVLPYGHYTDDDIAHRVVYVEASRGCPYRCEFCLSSLDQKVRGFPLDAFLDNMRILLERGARQFKFIDRTFNLNMQVGQAILQFFLDNYTPGLFLHFEMVPDRLPSGLRDLIAQFPVGALQFEIGIQTLNSDVAKHISRRQDESKIAENFAFLRQQTGVHIHADLIIGLPGEDLHSFATGFDRVLAWDPQEIQVGILKRLRGTPIIRHTEAFGMVYNPAPPYDILQNNLLDFDLLQRLKRFARYWDMIANSGQFHEVKIMLLHETTPDAPSAFYRFLALSDWLYATTQKQTHGIALERLSQLLLVYLTEHLGKDRSVVEHALLRDYQRSKPRKVPPFLAHVATPVKHARSAGVAPVPSLPQRQARHVVS